MAKRGSNIYKRKDGRFEGRVPVGYREDGKIKYHSVYARTLTELKQKMKVVPIVQKHESICIRHTIRSMAEEWLAEKQMTVKLSSYNNYSRLLRNHVYPHIGGVLYTSLTKQMLTVWLSNLLCSGRVDKKGGISTKTAREVLTIVKSVCSYAHSEYHLENPADSVKLPRMENKSADHAVLPEQERKRLEKYLLVNQTNTNVGILLCLYTGIRIGELCALQWSDFDFNRNELHITKTIQRISMGNKKSKLLIGTPKSRTSVRTIPIPSVISQMMLSIRKVDYAYVLSGTGKPIEPRTMQNRFKAVLRECGVRQIKFHGLRHTYATLCIENGFDPKALSELLGHADVNITLNRYVYSSNEMKRKYVDKLDALIG
jgi:Site-specific recombinase XerD